jgi:uncharacterized protein YmfQ (DUF2313 family)
MPAQIFRFPVFDASGNAVTTATPAFLVYKGADNASRTPPVISHQGEGIYGGTIRAGDVDPGVAYLIDCGAATEPRYYAGFAGRIFAFGTVDSTGALLTGQTPTFDGYRDSSGSPATQPAIVNFGSGLHAFVPTAGQYAAGVGFMIDLGAGADPQHVGGFLQDPTGYDAPVVVGSPTVTPPTDLVVSYARQLRQLLPPGSLWNLDADSWITATLLGISEELARVDERADDIIEESDPRTATETLDDWERALGLPDEAVPTIPATTAGRRLAVTQKLIRQGGQHAAFYVSLAAACGYTVTVNDAYGVTVCRAGARAGALCRGVPWAFAWRLDVSPPSGTALTHVELEAVIRRAAPAHTTVIFNYL